MRAHFTIQLLPFPEGTTDIHARMRLYTDKSTSCPNALLMMSLSPGGAKHGTLGFLHLLAAEGAPGEGTPGARLRPRTALFIPGRLHHCPQGLRSAGQTSPCHSLLPSPPHD